MQPQCHSLLSQSLLVLRPTTKMQGFGNIPSGLGQEETAIKKKLELQYTQLSKLK